MVGILDYFKTEKSKTDQLVDVGSPALRKKYEYEDFKEKVSAIKYPNYSKAGYLVVPKELLEEQGKLLFGYIINKNGKHQSDIDPNLLLDAAFKVVTPEGSNGLRVAQSKSDWKTTEELIKTATAEQLFSQAKDGTTALHGAVIVHNEKDALNIISKKGVTPEQLRLKDRAGETASYYAVEELKKNSGEDLSERVAIARIKNVITAVAKITGGSELEFYHNPVATQVFQNLSHERNRVRVLSTLKVYDGGLKDSIQMDEPKIIRGQLRKVE